LHIELIFLLEQLFHLLLFCLVEFFGFKKLLLFQFVGLFYLCQVFEELHFLLQFIYVFVIGVEFLLSIILDKRMQLVLLYYSLLLFLLF